MPEEVFGPERSVKTASAKRRAVALLWDEQGGACWLCHGQMLPYAKARDGDPEAATLDHVVPKVDGGPDTFGNLKLAHSQCNSIRGSMWMDNKSRARRGLAPLTFEHYFKGLIAKKRRYVITGLPQGATLPGYVPPPDGPTPPARAAVPRSAMLDKDARPRALRPVCAACGSIDIRRDAVMWWSETSGWALAEMLDGYECRACDAECGVIWR